MKRSETAGFYLVDSVDFVFFPLSLVISVPIYLPSENV